ncbi:MAG: L,D-transpeptidase family protein [Actinomycetia bacterium]|nr:L,D-transpeptidase family protein [Actinomycetes bacterium]
MGRWTPVFASAAVLAVVIFVGFSGGDKNEASNTTFDQNAGAVNESLTVPSSIGEQVVIPTDPAVEKTQLTSELKINSSGLAVAALQNRLKELAFDPGPADGYFGNQTRQAVWAFEKLVLGTPMTEATGHVTNEMWQLMQDPIEIAPRRVKAVTYNQRPTHAEIYLDKQVMIIFTDDKPVLITHISSGSGETWCEIVTYSIDAKGEPLPEPRTADECGESKTPGGVFSFYLRYEGNRQGPLGGMWNPVFFNYGIAVHGADEVPLHPASHGCIRIPNKIADYFPSLVQNKDRVYVWDGIKEPEEYSKEEKKPPGNYPNPAATTSTSTTVKKTTSTTVVTATTIAPTTTPSATTTTVPTTS